MRWLARKIDQTRFLYLCLRVGGMSPARALRGAVSVAFEPRRPRGRLVA